MKHTLYALLLMMLALSANAQDSTAILSSLPSHLSSPDSRLYDTYFLDAMLQRQKGNHDATFDLLNRCLELNPQASEAWFFLAQYYGEMKDQDRALQFMQRATELEPDNLTYMETLVRAYIGKQQYEDAIGVVERIYEKDKSRQDMLDMLSRLYLEVHNYEKAIDVIDRMEQIDGKSERFSLAKSSLYLQMDQPEKAQAEMKLLAEQYPNDLNYRTLYANTLMANDQRDEALDVLSQVLAEEPDNYRAQVAMRTYYLGVPDTLRADSLSRSILLNPNTSLDDKVNLMRQEMQYSESNGGDSTRVLSLFHEMLAQPDASADLAEFCAAYMNLKKMPRDSVQQMLQLALQLAPDNASARLQLVQYAWEDDDNDRVVSLCQEARQYNPDEMAFYYYQGMAFYRQDDHLNALEAFQNGISVITEESNPAIVSDFYAVMGDLLHQQGREREAFEAYDSCLQWKPDNIGCLNNYAYYLSELGQQLDRAEVMSYKAIKAEPKNATYLDTYAWIMFMQGRYAEARIYIDQTLQNDSLPGAVLLEHAGDIYAMVGDVERAVDYWQQALAEDPHNKMLMRKIKRKKYIKR